MCGIIGYTGDEQALPILADGLANLEYRGYDSAGIVLADAETTVYKTTGEVSALQATLPAETSHTRGIGHTRWSTHGPPTDANAHPHTDAANTVAVVHNGIIDNYDELKTALQAAGVSFTSATDTEVVPHLIARYREDGLAPADAFRATIEDLTGSYAIVATVAGDDRLFAARNDSPLVVGHGEGGTFLASDVPAFLDHTKTVTYLENGQVAVVGPETVTITADGESVPVTTETVEWEAAAAEKGGYEHYMHKEIHEQPQALRQTLSGRLDPEAGAVDIDIGLDPATLADIEEVQFVAAGTSHYAGRYATALFEACTDLRVTAEVASEYRFPTGLDPQRTLVVPVTQSGETADTIAATREASRAGATTLAVTNTLGSSITREAEAALFIRAGPEIGVAATKTFASQVATLGTLAVAVGRGRGELARGRARTIIEDLRSVPGALQQLLDREERIETIAHEYADGTAFFYIGRHAGVPVALEGALKLKEIAYVHAEGFPAGELKHGPLALVTEETPVLATLTEGARPEATLHNVKEAQARGAPVIGASSIDRGGKYLDVELPVPAAGLFEPLVATVYWQLFAYHIADLDGRSIDKPRNLAKSVTVE